MYHDRTFRFSIDLSERTDSNYYYILKSCRTRKASAQGLILNSALEQINLQKIFLFFRKVCRSVSVRRAWCLTPRPVPVVWCPTPAIPIRAARARCAYRRRGGPRANVQRDWCQIPDLKSSAA
jgi:hypothetical protein